ncbi:MAG TPA: Crp/Fnr family transcriptional regulator [Bacteroidia bacterium]|nr:Crp/Fnr family transcriptional regulator [Bacteroidota bacterium]MBL0052319.1 Crp/Fnr family transcriptional regulator [Bacteroidota bacterium]HRC33211.1 Crp/Fnr family transcriptional regulator [Bacteroidia bacterium]
MNSDKKFWYLRNHQLYNTLSDNELDSLCIIASYKEGKKGDIINFTDRENELLYSVKEGTFKICYQDDNAHEIISEILTQGDLFGRIHLSRKGNNNRDEYAKVISDTFKICSFEAEKFKEMLKNNPDLSLKYSDYISEKMESFQMKYTDLVFKDVYTRVADFYKRYAFHSAKATGNSADMEMILTHQEIADYIAASRQTVTQIINTLVAEGKIIYQGRKRVIIPDMQKL